MTALPDLVERLLATNLPDRALDREIMALFYRWDQKHIGAKCWDDKHDTCCPEARHLDWVWSDPVTDQFLTTAKDGYRFTASLNEALAMAELALDQRGRGPININICLAGSAQVVIDSAGPCDLPLAQVVASSAALAVCAAALQARGSK